jgi:hypothetical protein
MDIDKLLAKYNINYTYKTDLTVAAIIIAQAIENAAIIISDGLLQSNLRPNQDIASNSYRSSLGSK